MRPPIEYPIEVQLKLAERATLYDKVIPCLIDPETDTTLSTARLDALCAAAADFARALCPASLVDGECKFDITKASYSMVICSISKAAGFLMKPSSESTVMATTNASDLMAQVLSEEAGGGQLVPLDASTARTRDVPTQDFTALEEKLVSVSKDRLIKILIINDELDLIMIMIVIIT